MAGEKKPPPVRLVLKVFGTRNHCSFAVKATQGGRPVSGQRVEFYFAFSTSDEVPVARLEVGGSPKTCTTDPNGFANLGDQDLSDIDDQITAVQVVSQDAGSFFVSLPTESSLPGVTFGKKVERLKVVPATDEISSRTGYFNLTIQTFDDNGNAVDDVVSVSLDSAFLIRDGASGAVLNPAAIQIPKRGLTIKVIPRGFTAECTVTHESTGAVLVKKLQYQY